MKARRALSVCATLLVAPLVILGWWITFPAGVGSSVEMTTGAATPTLSVLDDVRAPVAPAPSASVASGSETVRQPAETAAAATEEAATPGAAEPSAAPAAVAARVSPVRALDYQRGDFSQWAEVQTARDDQVTLVTSPARAGSTYSARFTVAPGDHVFGDVSTIRGEVRADLDDPVSPTEGMGQWFAWSTLFPEEFDWDGDWLLYTQWHQTARTGTPPVAFHVTGSGQAARLALTVRGGQVHGDVPPYVTTFDLGPLQRGVWLDHKVSVVWSSTPGAGRIAVWINGAQVLAPTAVANLYVGQSAYLKQGLYASASTKGSHTVYHTGTRIGPTEASVALP